MPRGRGETGGTGERPCLLERAQLPAVPSTLLIPLAARAHGGRYFAWMACQDAVATRLLASLGANVNPYLDDLPTVLNVLWRTRAIKEAGRAFFAEHPQGLGVNLAAGSRTISSGSTRAPTAGWMPTCPR